VKPIADIRAKMRVLRGFIRGVTIGLTPGGC
jgi:hypothetical protein